MNTRRFVCALILNVFVLAGAMFPEDKKPAPPPTNPGWHELLFYRGTGSSSTKQEEMGKIEMEMNGALAQIPGIECIKVNPVFGKSNKDLRLVVRYKVGENKDRKPPKIKLFDLLDISATRPREEDSKRREEFYEDEKNRGMNLLSDADYYYDGRHLTILIYDPAP
ncbi:MAG: hypothetical protein Q7R85_03635 [bacterium]|nr:hypothetical protein [bacterium]